MFSSLTGNTKAKLTLQRLLAHGRVPNSLLFAGPEGVGKRQFAIELARAAVCSDMTNGEACGVCGNCVRAGQFNLPKSEKKDDYEVVAFSGHPDVGTVIPFKRNIRVDAIRHLEKEANFNPFEARARFFIVDDADKMADPPANALLKTLEEPPPTTHIILITSRPDSLLPTIRSRCQTVWFAPVERHEIEEYLMKERAFSHHEAQLAAAVARGSISRAIEIDVEKYRHQSERALYLVRNAMVTGDVTALLKTGEELNDAKNKDAFEENLDILESVIHDVWKYAITSNTNAIANVEHAEAIQNIAMATDRKRLSDWLSGIELMRQRLAVNINRKVATDALFVAAGAK